MNIEVKLEDVHGVTRDSIPNSDETILTDIDINPEQILTMEIYFRKPENCSFGRGNWIIDIRFLNGRLFCILLPKEMTPEQVLAWAKPLTDQLEGKAKWH